MTDVATEFQPMFIVGMSRGGTTWMKKCLHEHPDVAAFGETIYWGRGYVLPDEAGLYHEEQLAELRKRLKKPIRFGMNESDAGALQNLNEENLAAFIDETLAIELPCTPADVYKRLCEGVIKIEGKTYAVEKTPHHVMWVDRILEALPNAKFLILLREPYGFMLSYKHQGDRKAEEGRKRFEKRYHPYACAVVWRGYMRAWKKAVEKHPGQVMTVRFEETRKDPEKVLQAVQQFFGFEPVAGLADRVPPDNGSFPGGVRPELAPDDIFWMNTVAKAEILAYGSEIRKPKGAGPVIASIAKLPGWALGNVISLKKHTTGSLSSYLRRWLNPS